MEVYYGFMDGSGEWFLRLDTDRCDGCARCVEVCPGHVLEVGPDELDPLGDGTVARVRDEELRKLRYTCAPCRPGCGDGPTPCMAACGPEAISFTEAWKLASARS
jgi:ferredoxin